MNIKGLDYNTQREKLVMPEYGREIQKMVDLAIGLPTKELRNQCAWSIIRQMEAKNPALLSAPDYEQTLCDHLYLMSHKQLDIDWPCDVGQADKLMSKPQPMVHPVLNERSQMRHYGRLIGKLFEYLEAMPEGPERDELARLTANQMKRDLMAWGHGSIEDEKVADDLTRFTHGKIQIDVQRFRLGRAEASSRNEGRVSGEGKKSKRKR